MNKTAASGEENLYFELESVKKETEAGIYNDVASESATAVTQQTSIEKCMQGAEEKRQASTEHECTCQCDTVVPRRMLFVVAAVAAVALLTAIATLIVALTVMKSRNASTAKVQGVGSTSTMKSENGDIIEKVSENITSLGKRMEEQIRQVEKSCNEQNKELLRNEIVKSRTLLENQTAKLVEQTTSQEKMVKNLTNRLASTELELIAVKAQLDGQIAGLWIATNSTTGQLSKLKNVWKAVNVTVEETANLTNKVNNELKNVWRGVNDSTERLLSEMTSSIQVVQMKVNNKMETVWFHLNKSRKCCNNLTSSLQSFRTSENIVKNLTNRLASTQLELKAVKAQLDGQITGLWIATNSTTGQQSQLRNVRKAVNATVEETANLTNKVDEEFKNVWRGVNESLENTLTKMTSYLQVLQKKVNNEMETVWFHLNKSRECCNNLTSSLQSFRTSVTYRSLRLEARIEIEEQKSNNTSLVEISHFF